MKKILKTILAVGIVVIAGVGFFLLGRQSGTTSQVQTKATSANSNAAVQQPQSAPQNPGPRCGV